MAHGLINFKLSLAGFFGPIDSRTKKRLKKIDQITANEGNVVFDVAENLNIMLQQ